MNSFDIRLEAIKSNRDKDGDNLRFNRECSRLSIYVTQSLRRCINAGDNNCSELEDLLDYIDSLVRTKIAC